MRERFHIDLNNVLNYCSESNKSSLFLCIIMKNLQKLQLLLQVTNFHKILT